MIAVHGKDCQSIFEYDNSLPFFHTLVIHLITPCSSVFTPPLSLPLSSEPPLKQSVHPRTSPSHTPQPPP
ncbi:hypothetical protein HBH56_129820 [Parastagonospora nodorum]|uniref:Uncharacterized protein n=1 Tax=Phaeosphaeria nodorum (strain SN15 / ATCC MYA-4574 / FGSC 10173) TaxID=321614 RepID=A0A7U2I969_PHANO|nr:hypothetical protein HBH56_129820 [Parastagonospora nodorum]QRD05568.1 hypothetical protein JI435_058520 [Parastagonospora nodorum SN15]KAH3947383.1 hypothetical protein HBH53_120130 [Parastagonospora nodorum]KAH3996337.1 hypothetical protein HBI10_157910 [Parastagonospora nodorum]KAH4135243.1 hypothetical protein HBH45_155390 [Parastagonospora nodorum]